jgi:hypothetical protein
MISKGLGIFGLDMRIAGVFGLVLQKKFREPFSSHP